MKLRIVVPDATSAAMLADRLIFAFGSEHVSLRDGRREVDVRIDREPDSAIDVRTGRAAGVRTVGVRYGFDPESLGREPPDALIEDLRELVALV